MEDELNIWQMEDNLNILANGRQPQYFGKWKTTLIFWQMEDQTLCQDFLDYCPPFLFYKVNIY